MRKLLSFIINLYLFNITSTAQNVGIGSAAPLAKLQINHKTTAASPTLRLFDSTAGTGSSILFAKESQSNSFSVVSTIGTFAANNSLDFRTTFNSGILLRGDGKIGINNITNPVATLHIGGGVKINDTLNVTGDINITGKFKVNNDAGTAGQVLISGGAGNNPEWAASSFPANERAWITTNNMSITAAPFQATLDLENVDYNTSSANIDFTNNTITINKSGLYRFQGMIYAIGNTIVTNSGPYARCTMRLQDDNITFLAADELLYENAGNLVNRGITFSTDRYITAGSVISFVFNFGNILSASSVGILGSSNSSTYLSFYLISE
jgi:hypothetical protein